jgi:NDP-sugar pyrophosphorylase family protein
MSPGPGLDGIDVVVLAGGLGTRLRGVLGEGQPKILAPVQGRPFLDLMVEWMAAAGAGRIILSLGHLAEQVIAHLDRGRWPLPVVTVIEPQPLGTGGALRYVLPSLRGDPVMVINGDTWLDADLGAALAAHRQTRCAASLVCVKVPDGQRYGRIEVDAQGVVTRFVEKAPDPGPALINAGICLLSAPALARLGQSTGPSFERDVLAELPRGWLRAHVCESARFIDIGTPESLSQAGDVITPGRTPEGAS